MKPIVRLNASSIPTNIESNGTHGHEVATVPYHTLYQTICIKQVALSVKSYVDEIDDTSGQIWKNAAKSSSQAGKHLEEYTLLAFRLAIESQEAYKNVKLVTNYVL